MWPISVGIKSTLEIAITEPGIFVFNDVFQPGGLDIAIAQGNALSITHIFCGFSPYIRHILGVHVVLTRLNIFVGLDPGECGYFSLELSLHFVFQPGGLDIAIAQGNALGRMHPNIAACRAAIGTYAKIH